jgi:hypothetical protein
VKAFHVRAKAKAMAQATVDNLNRNVLAEKAKTEKTN